MALPTVMGISSKLPPMQQKLCNSKMHTNHFFPQHASPGAARQVQISTFYGPALKARKNLY